MKLRNYLFSIILIFSGINAFSQSVGDDEKIAIKPLFEYPTAPENLSDLNQKCNYLVEHFWDKLDTKSKKVVDQNALFHAFTVFISPMQWADKEVSHNATDKLISKISKNPTLTLQMTKAAEEAIYGPRAEMFIDEIYLKFLNAIVKNKKVSDLYRSRYEKQLTALEGSMPGKTAPAFNFIDREGETKLFTPTGNYTLIEFGDPSCYDCKMTELKLEANAAISDLVKRGKLNICFFVTTPDDSWVESTKEYPSSWIVGSAEDADEKYDIRLKPTLYIIGPDGKILNKNISINTAINTIVENCK